MWCMLSSNAMSWKCSALTCHACHIDLSLPHCLGVPCRCMLNPGAVSCIALLSDCSTCGSVKCAPRQFRPASRKCSSPSRCMCTGHIQCHHIVQSTGATKEACDSSCWHGRAMTDQHMRLNVIARTSVHGMQRNKHIVSLPPFLVQLP